MSGAVINVRALGRLAGTEGGERGIHVLGLEGGLVPGRIRHLRLDHADRSQQAEHARRRRRLSGYPCVDGSSRLLLV